MIEQWYEQFAPDLTRFIRSKGFTTEDAEDLCAQVFMEAVQRQPEGTAPRAWLYAVARSRIIDRWRMLERKPETELDERVAGEWDIEAAAVEQDSTAHMHMLIAQLRASHRAILTLRFIEGKTLKEAADALHTTVGAVKARQARAKGAIQRLLAGPKVYTPPPPKEKQFDVRTLDNRSALLLRCLHLEHEVYLLQQQLASETGA